MGFTCIVRGCKSVWYPACDVLFHKLPSEQTMLNKWSAAVPMQTPFYASAKICSLHFKETDYHSSGKRLLVGAVPFYRESNILNQTTPPSVLEHALTCQSANTPPCKKSCLLELLTPQEENIHYENKLQMTPSPLPVHESKCESANNPPCKISRLFEVFTHQKKNIDYEHKLQISNQSTSPIKISSNNKTTQAKPKTSKKEALKKRKNILVQKVVRLNKSVIICKDL